jgi:hypothetical protein
MEDVIGHRGPALSQISTRLDRRGRWLKDVAMQEAWRIGRDIDLCATEAD